MSQEQIFSINRFMLALRERQLFTSYFSRQDFHIGRIVDPRINCAWLVAKALKPSLPASAKGEFLHRPVKEIEEACRRYAIPFLRVDLTPAVSVSANVMLLTSNHASALVYGL